MQGQMAKLRVINDSGQVKLNGQRLQKLIVARVFIYSGIFFLSDYLNGYHHLFMTLFFLPIEMLEMLLIFFTRQRSFL